MTSHDGGAHVSDPDGLLDALAAELSDRGLIEHGDFYITGRGSGRPPSSEIVAMRFTEGNYRVWYRDMGVSRTLVESPDFQAAREVFVREALRLARYRGRRLRED